MTDLFLGEFLASSHLAYLMALVVPARCAIAAVVFPLASDALAASFAFLLSRFIAESALAVSVADSTSHVMLTTISG